MIDRSYLPFPSAREYQDRKMAKWMGFFLSEHSSALVDDSNTKTFSSSLSLEQKYLYIRQLYVHQLYASIRIAQGKERLIYTGIVSSIGKTDFLLKTDQGYIRIFLNTLLSIDINEEVYDEPA